MKSCSRDVIRLALPGLLLLVPVVLGITGCRPREGPGDSAAASQKKLPDDYVIGDLTLEPSDAALRQNLVKPGHLMSATVAAKANNFDARVDLEMELLDRSDQPLQQPDTAFRLIASRPLALPKGQQKLVETMFLVPREITDSQGGVFLESRLMNVRGGQEIKHGREPTTLMAGYQYFFLVLAANVDDYGYWKNLESVRPPHSEFDPEAAVLFYRVILAPLERPLRIPQHPLAWTSVAYVLWDNISPELLTPEQQESLLDWLHWGGQIIVSGPDSLDTLAGSFLDPYLPAEKRAARNLGAADLEELNASWALTEKRTRTVHRLEASAEKPLVGVELGLRPNGQWVTGTGSLVAERRVGRGRIVITAFDLADRPVVNWKSYDSFVNGCLLRRPRRRFELDEQQLQARARWVEFPADERNPLFSSTTRYFTRDVGVPQDKGPSRPDWHLDGHRSSPDAGLGGWNDYSGPSDAARRLLRDAAGIEIPSAGFVLRVLAVYLVILVPVNWCVFRLLGRVEWAWLAAPLIAMGGGVAVVRLAQLDIGFVRSQTQVAVIEMHGGYRRGHLTRYTALYTSLGTAFAMEFADRSAVARPFPQGRTNEDRQFTAYLRRDEQVTLAGFQVDSASTGMVHSEQMVDLGGPLEGTWADDGSFRVTNNTAWDLDGVALMWRNPAGQAESAYVGSLSAKTTRTVTMAPVAGSLWFDAWGPPLEAASVVADNGTQIDLRRLLQTAAQNLRLPPGDVRLVGWIDTPLAGMQVAPRPAQENERTMVVAHLAFGGLPDPRPDVNLLLDVQTALPPAEDDEPLSGADTDPRMD